MNLIRTGRLASFAAAALVLAACESQPTTPTAAAPLLNETDRLVVNVEDVQESTLRYLFSTKGAEGMDAYCVSTGYPESDDDAAATLLARFADQKPAVVALSGCTISVSGDTYNATGGPAEWFKVGSPQVQGRKASIPAAFHINGRLAESFLCELRYHRGAWTVAGCELTAAA
ncbi:MAG TPA: hypothetical protein VGC13_15370 [Longimicrobium sp.]|jgi:hypothetical protein|uniref:hypothetical protein n=1 Tax=Longimicrobium sp. TaxID=2029185 RepID=UPI002ED90597